MFFKTILFLYACLIRFFRCLGASNIGLTKTENSCDKTGYNNVVLDFAISAKNNPEIVMQKKKKKLHNSQSCLLTELRNA